MTDKPTKSLIIGYLLRGGKIPRSYMTMLHHEIVNNGHANYSNGVMYANWKTPYWRPPVPYVESEPKSITSRFEILDIR